MLVTHMSCCLPTFVRLDYWFENNILISDKRRYKKCGTSTSYVNVLLFVGNVLKCIVYI
jgi:hypothetical protein